jgi:tRNA threonylcarbamoyladenosine biosynthesis protein TsaB
VILSIDTTREFGSLALIADEDALEEVALQAEDGFGHVIFGHIADLLERHHRSIRDIECFASASGPGSFTGVRVGLACAKGLAEALGKPIVTVSNLQALAAFGSHPLRATLLDARRGEIYGAVYNSDLEPVKPEVVMPFSDWLRTLPPGPLELISTDPYPKLVDPRITVTQAPRAVAAAIGRIASRKLAQGLTLDPAEADANYIRRSDAELFWKA